MPTMRRCSRQEGEHVHPIYIEPVCMRKILYHLFNQIVWWNLKLLRQVESDLRLGNKSLQEKIRTIENKFINSVEMSAQEAAYFVLGQKLNTCSRDEIFVNTSQPEKRVSLLKSMDANNSRQL